MYKDWVRYGNILLGDKVHFCVRGVRGYCKRMLGMILRRIVGDLVYLAFCKNEIKKKICK